MYDYGYYDYGYESVATGVAGFAIFAIIMYVISIGVGIFSIVCMWKVFTKAGKPGWAAIVPIYNTIVMIEIAELPMWYIALFLVPFANIYAMFKVYIELASKFGKSAGFGVGMVFFAPIFFAILAFDKKCNFVGNTNQQPMQNNYQQPMQNNYQQPMNQPVQPMEQPVAPVAPTFEPQAPVQQTGPKFCTVCGNPIAGDAKFCTKCGNKL